MSSVAGYAPVMELSMVVCKAVTKKMALEYRRAPEREGGDPRQLVVSRAGTATMLASTPRGRRRPSGEAESATTPTYSDEPSRPGARLAHRPLSDGKRLRRCCPPLSPRSGETASSR